MLKFFLPIYIERHPLPTRSPAREINYLEEKM